MKSALEKLKDEIEHNYNADIAAVNQLLGIYSKERETTTKTLAGFVEASRPVRRVSQIVEEMIKRQAGNFSIPTICFQYRQETGKGASENVRALISQAINKLKHRNPPEIIEVEKGMGSRSGVYRLAK